VIRPLYDYYSVIHKHHNVLNTVRQLVWMIHHLAWVIHKLPFHYIILQDHSGNLTNHTVLSMFAGIEVDSSAGDLEESKK